MFHYVYASTATKLFTKCQLRDLVLRAERRNVRLGVTGMLAYKDGKFMQVLEGNKDAVMKLAASIGADRRHKGVIVLLEGKRDQRDFSDWSMGFRNLGEGSAANIPGCSDFMDASLTGKNIRKNQSAR